MDIFFKEILIKSKSIKGLSVSLNWDCNEGNSGEYDENDNTDVPLLRFDISYAPNKKDYYEMQDASFCTQLSALDDRELLIKATKVILKEAENTFQLNDKRASIGKRTMEQLSWLSIENGSLCLGNFLYL